MRKGIISILLVSVMIWTRVSEASSWYAGMVTTSKYIGVSASIKTPSSFPNVGTSGESAWVSTSKDVNNHWVQTGARYYNGFANIQTYTESYQSGVYTLTTIGIHLLGTDIPYKIEYHYTDGKWHAYIGGYDKAAGALSTNTITVQANAEVHANGIQMGPYEFTNVQVKQTNGYWTNNTKLPRVTSTYYHYSGNGNSFRVYGP